MPLCTPVHPYMWQPSCGVCQWLWRLNTNWNAWTAKGLRAQPFRSLSPTVQMTHSHSQSTANSKNAHKLFNITNAVIFAWYNVMLVWYRIMYIQDSCFLYNCIQLIITCFNRSQRHNQTYLNVMTKHGHGKKTYRIWTENCRSKPHKVYKRGRESIGQQFCSTYHHHLKGSTMWVTPLVLLKLFTISCTNRKVFSLNTGEACYLSKRNPWMSVGSTN